MTTSIQPTARLSIALPLPKFLKEALAECQEWLQSYPEMQVIDKWILPENMHINLHFLGEVSHFKVAQLKEKLSENESLRFSANLSLRGLSTFKKEGLPTVIWVGLEQNDWFVSLQEQLAALLQQVDLEAEITPHVPYVALAYVEGTDEQKSAIAQKMEKIKVGEVGIWEASQIELLSSVQTQEGYVYKIIS